MYKTVTIVGEQDGRHVEISETFDGKFEVMAFLFVRPDGEKVLSRCFASRTLKTYNAAEAAATRWLLRQQVNQRQAVA